MINIEERLKTFSEKEIKLRYVVLGFILFLSLGLLSGTFGSSYFTKEKQNPPEPQNGLSISDLEMVVPIEHSSEDDETEICVEVAGAVMSPGVFCLKSGSRVVDALARAGEFNYESYAYKYVSRRISLARELKPNEKIYIPFADDVSCETLSFAYVDEEIEARNSGFLGVTEGKDGDSGSADSSGSGGDGGGSGQGGDGSGTCISINSATIDQLTTINGIGQVTAQNIINERPFTTLEQLLDVNGIGQAKYELLLDFVCL